MSLDLFLYSYSFFVVALGISVPELSIFLMDIDVAAVMSGRSDAAGGPLPTWVCVHKEACLLHAQLEAELPGQSRQPITFTSLIFFPRAVLIYIPTSDLS